MRCRCLAICLSCGSPYEPRRNVPKQQYCSEASCQRHRRRAWQRRKLAQDADYRDNQARAHAAWLQRHGSYMPEYRRKHPEYRERDRQQRADRRRRAAEGHAVKMDECHREGGVASGTYRIRPIHVGGAVKMDEYVVQLVVVRRDAVGCAAP